MTQQKTFKRRVRARMAKTGESYTAARRQLLTDAPPPFEPPVAEERVVAEHRPRLGPLARPSWTSGAPAGARTPRSRAS